MGKSEARQSEGLSPKKHIGDKLARLARLQSLLGLASFQVLPDRFSRLSDWHVQVSLFNET
jgi:hypothetical protein